jgi:hypothetical protein
LLVPVTLNAWWKNGSPREAGKVLDRDKVRQLHRQGFGVRAIARQLGVSHMTVQRIGSGVILKPDG